MSYTAQTLTEGQKAQARANIGADTGSGGAELFVATYGSTSSAEIEAAYQAGKTVIVNSGAYRGYLCLRNSATSHSFSEVAAYYGAQGVLMRIFSCSEDRWTTGTYYAELSSSKVTSITASSTDTQYPSAKAVYDFAPVLTAPDGSKWQLNVSNSGAVSSTKVT